VKERPEGLADADVAAALARHWDIAVSEFRYAPVGFGGYHWSGADPSGSRWFVTVTDLARFDSFGHLEQAMDATARLARAGLEFIVAPVPAASGRAVFPLGNRYAITVLPFADGIPGRWGDPLTAADKAKITGMLARLHQAREHAGDLPVQPTDLRGRADIDASLRERAGSWQSGPYGEPARLLVKEHAASLAAALDAFDQLSTELSPSAADLVITHGEIHAGNLIRSGQELLLIDWDTVGLARPERDLWWIVSESSTEAAQYAQLTRREVNEAALSLYRLRWDLDDVAEFLGLFRGPHERSADTETAWRGLAGMFGRLVAPTPG
jgi:spectinomycin phosphotransferase